jgi:hypothetical protein
MKGRALLPIVVATITATASWAFVTYLIKSQMDWLSAIAFVVLFAVIFGVLWWRWSPQGKG